VWRSDSNPEIEYMTREQHLMMNFWLPDFGDWNEGFDPVGMPWYARYDYVEVWDYVYPEDWDSTQGADQYHPFEFRWKDDFDTFDDTRWVKSDDWSFWENRVTFWASQVDVVDGALVLKMEPRDGSTDDGTGGDGGDDGTGGDGDADGTCENHE